MFWTSAHSPLAPSAVLFISASLACCPQLGFFWHVSCMLKKVCLSSSRSFPCPLHADLLALVLALVHLAQSSTSYIPIKIETEHLYIQITTRCATLQSSWLCAFCWHFQLHDAKLAEVLRCTKYALIMNNVSLHPPSSIIEVHGQCSIAKKVLSIYSCLSTE
jgi:hypothetical protein